MNAVCITHWPGQAWFWPQINQWAGVLLNTHWRFQITEGCQLPAALDEQRFVFSLPPSLATWSLVPETHFCSSITQTGRSCLWGSICKGNFDFAATKQRSEHLGDAVCQSLLPGWGETGVLGFFKKPWKHFGTPSWPGIFHDTSLEQDFHPSAPKDVQKANSRFPWRIFSAFSLHVWSSYQGGAKAVGCICLIVLLRGENVHWGVTLKR